MFPVCFFRSVCLYKLFRNVCLAGELCVQQQTRQLGCVSWSGKSFLRSLYEMLSATAACSPPPTFISPLYYKPFSFLSSHPLCQRLIGLEMIRFILKVNAVIMLLLEKKGERKTTPHMHLSLI